jgi:hypothetical protein
MKAIALTFSYDLDKLKSNGRFWADKVYGTTEDVIFSYSAASYATFIDKNPNIELFIYTDNPQLMCECMNLYAVDQSKIIYINYKDKIKTTKQSKFTFQPLVEMLFDSKKYNDYILKIDNDLIWNNTLPKFDENNDILVWKYERLVCNGDPRMGEIKVCESVCNNINFKIYNTGVLGYPHTYEIETFYDICQKMTEVDIKSVSDLGVNVWHVCDQTAHCWVFHQKKYNIIELHNYVDHYYDNKLICLEKAKHLKKY